MYSNWIMYGLLSMKSTSNVVFNPLGGKVVNARRQRTSISSDNDDPSSDTSSSSSELEDGSVIPKRRKQRHSSGQKRRTKVPYIAAAAGQMVCVYLFLILVSWKKMWAERKAKRKRRISTRDREGTQSKHYLLNPPKC